MGRRGVNLLARILPNGPRSDDLELSNDIFDKIDTLPPMNPLDGFKWHFMAGTWAMVHDFVSTPVGVASF